MVMALYSNRLFPKKSVQPENVSAIPQTVAAGQSATRPTGRIHPLWRRLAVLVLLALAVDALFVEPYRIEVTHFVVKAPIASPLKIAHLTDLHTRGIGLRERKVLADLDAENPDVIVVTGDSLAGYGGTYAECKEFYRRLHAPLGVWFVRGNWENDHPMRPARREREFYDSAGVHLLDAQAAQLRPDVWFVGISTSYRVQLSPQSFLSAVPQGAYKIALYHEPAIFDRLAGHVDLALSGHTHGGQVRIPYIYPFWLPSGSGSYLEGWYNKAGTKMYVSRGVGMSELPIRFLCRPEVAIITLEPANSSS